MSEQSQELRAIRQLAADWRSGWLRGDVDLLLSLWAAEPILMPQDQPPVIGKEAIGSIYKSVLNEFDFSSESKLVEAQVSGDWGYFWSAYTLTATPKTGGQPIRSSGKSIFIVKRQRDGAWKIARLMDNSDGAPNAQAPPTG